MSKKQNIFLILFLVLIDLIVCFSTYIKIYFPLTNVEQLLFCTNFGLSNSDFTPIVDAIIKVWPFLMILFICLYLVFYKTIIKNYKKISIIIVSIITIILLLFNFNIHKVIYYRISYSNFIKNNYIDSKKVNIEFKEKKNLVFIILESFEGTLLDSKNGGSFSYNLIPEVSEILNNDYSTTFKNTDGKVGYKMIDGASYTSASLITNNSAVPFKYDPFTKLNDKKFMNNTYTLGEILKDNGYHNELISSATTSFGGVNTFFKKHGNYNIIDIDNLDKNNLKIKENNLIDWGFNDKYTFETAKKRLDYLSKKEEPFNLTLVGIDTHFPRGYRSDYTINKYEDEYANVYRTESMLVKDFIDYISTKDYFSNTVVVIIGDHLSMQRDFYSKINFDDRYVFATYINATKKNNLLNRKYTALDTTPTILGAMGASIDGDKLGLGVNMFSNKKTLAEKYGYKKLDEELKKNSKYYYKYIY